VREVSPVFGKSSPLTSLEQLVYLQCFSFYERLMT